MVKQFFRTLPSMFSGDINALRTILLYHINNGVFIGGGLESGVTNMLRSLQGSNLRVMYVSIEGSSRQTKKAKLRKLLIPRQRNIGLFLMDFPFGDNVDPRCSPHPLTSRQKYTLTRTQRFAKPIYTVNSFATSTDQCVSIKLIKT